MFTNLNEALKALVIKIVKISPSLEPFLSPLADAVINGEEKWSNPGLTSGDYEAHAKVCLGQILNTYLDTMKEAQEYLLNGPENNDYLTDILDEVAEVIGDIYRIQRIYDKELL